MNPDHLPVLLEETCAAAARLQRKLGLPAAERRDLQQDFLVDLLSRLPAYDPARGGIGPFAGAVVRHRASRFASRTISARRQSCGGLLSLADDAGRDLAGSIPEESALWAGPPNAEVADRLLRLSSVLGRLDADDLALCVDLAAEDVAELLRTGRYSRSTLYRRIARLRLVFAAFGLSKGSA